MKFSYWMSCKILCCYKNTEFNLNHWDWLQPCSRNLLLLTVLLRFIWILSLQLCVVESSSRSLQITRWSCVLRAIKQVRPSEFELECQHTIKSHGRQLARDHKHDWLILLLLVVIEITLNVINPFYRFVGEGMMGDLMYPLKENTVPIWAVPVSRNILLFKSYHS